MPGKNLRVLGITGGIASGKTTLLRLFEKRGWKTLEADEVVRNLWETDADIFLFLEKERLKDKNDFLRRLSEAPIEASRLLTKVEEILRPKITEKITAFIQKNTPQDWIALEIPLLYERGWNAVCGWTLVVETPHSLQKQRFLERAEVSEVLFDLFRERHIPCSQKTEVADFVVSGTLNPYDKEREIEKIDQHIRTPYEREKLTHPHLQ